MPTALRCCPIRTNALAAPGTSSRSARYATLRSDLDWKRGMLETFTRAHCLYLSLCYPGDSWSDALEKIPCLSLSKHRYEKRLVSAQGDGPGAAFVALPDWPNADRLLSAVEVGPLTMQSPQTQGKPRLR